MPVERELWARSFDKFPYLPCPRCRAGRLKIVRDSIRGHRAEWMDELRYSDPSNYNKEVERFEGFAKCVRDECGEVVVFAGLSEGGWIEVDIGDGERGGERQIAMLHVKVMVPGPRMIRLPEYLAAGVAEAMSAAFTTYWGSMNACAANMRNSLERLLDEHGVPRYLTNAKGKQVFMTLDARLKVFQHAKVTSDWLDALRIVGNLGTHGDVGEEALFDALDIYEHVLSAIYDKDPVSETTRLAQLIKASKGTH